MEAAQLLWPHQTLPPWNPETLFSLFMRHQDYALEQIRRESDDLAISAWVSEGAPAYNIEPADLDGPTARETEEFTHQVMNLVAMNMGRKKRMESLDKSASGKVASDVAQDIVFFIVRRTHRFKMKVPCYPVLIKSLNRAIFRLMLDAIDSEKRHRTSRPEVPLTDDGLQWVASHGDPGSIRELGQFLRSEQTQREVIRYVEGDINVTLLLYRYAVRQIIIHNTLPAFASLPKKLKARSSIEQHAFITVRLLVWVRRFAERSS